MLEIQRRGKQSIAKEQNAKEFYAFWYLPKQGFVLKQSAQETIDVSVLSILLFTIRVFAVAFAYLLLHEPVTFQLVLGGLVILAVIVLISTEKNS